MAKFYGKLRSTRIKTGLWTIVILVILIVSYLWFTNQLNVNPNMNYGFYSPTSWVWKWGTRSCIAAWRRDASKA